MEDTGTGFKELVGLLEESADDGRSRLVLEAAERHLNPAGTVHGGVLASLVDMAMGDAVRSLTGDSDVPATSQLTVTYLRPGGPGRLEVTAKVRKQGEHLTVCEADVEQEGRALVHALATFAVLHR
ncbi:MAG: uncharacterized domain 1 [uncultured Nocardioidaceae bacterium]|uniref:Uncharacterized domain 1 n=1 Tax=uncultured Nocardioidaceae bacterium TaxID=253824 RepID=A0A6J4MIT1_9ACTN|nr:MAG: uncharacterized domain 1 [uncultured Nocardioidaceae bacterium]